MRLLYVLILVLMFRMIGNCQHITFFPVDIYKNLIEREEFETIEVYTIKEDRTDKRLASSHRIDRALHEIYSEHYPYNDDFDAMRYISKFNEEWKVELVEAYGPEGFLFRQDEYSYENGNLVSHKEYQAKKIESDDGDEEISIVKKEYIHIYGDDHNEVIGIMYYDGWERENLLYEERFGYEFDSEGRIIYKSFESNRHSLEEFDLKTESYWDYRKNKVKYEKYQYRPDRKETAVKIYDDDLLIGYKYENHAGGEREYRIEYNNDGLAKRLITTHTRNGKSSQGHKIYEYFEK